MKEPMHLPKRLMTFGCVMARIVYYARLVTFLIQQLVIEMALWVAIKLKRETLSSKLNVGITTF
ncbi:hypothetical protein ABEY82_15320 [Priestia megaterium]